MSIFRSDALQRQNIVQLDGEMPEGIQRSNCLFGGAYRDRTDDPLLAKQVLSQLS